MRAVVRVQPSTVVAVVVAMAVEVLAMATEIVMVTEMTAKVSEAH